MRKTAATGSAHLKASTEPRLQRKLSISAPQLLQIIADYVGVAICRMAVLNPQTTGAVEVSPRVGGREEPRRREDGHESGCRFGNREWSYAAGARA